MEGKSMTNSEWLNRLDEKEMLLHMAGLAYSYYNRMAEFKTEIPVDEESYKEAMGPYLEFVESRLGGLTAQEAYQDWEKKTCQCGNIEE